MNIFVTDEDPWASAAALDDKRVVKMVLESAQILSTAIWLRSQEFYNHIILSHSTNDSVSPTPGPVIYRPTHKKHPVVLWVCESVMNYDWLWEHAVSLLKIYGDTYERVHKTGRVLDVLGNISIGDVFPNVRQTPFANCARRDDMDIDFTHITPVTEAYREYLKARWALDTRAPTWKERDLPRWMVG